MKSVRDRSGVAALEMALVAPILAGVLIVVIDFAGALLSKEKVAHALGRAGEYATLAGLNSVGWTIIATNAATIAGSVTGPFVGTPTITAVVNEDRGSGSQCCPNSSGLNCNTGVTSCPDGSTPGSYLKVTARYPIRPLFSADTYLSGESINDSVIAIVSPMP